MSRDLRVADFVRDEVSRILQRDMRDPRVGNFVSVNDVKVSKDLSYAEIYVSSLQAEDAQAQTELIDVLNRAAGFFRTELAKRHTMRTTPKPRFHYDELVERGPKLEKLIGQAVSQDQQRADQNVSDESASLSSET
jgi:ribosome-binding factor A